jgi:membrane-bound serine protease (ClpP class)
MTLKVRRLILAVGLGGWLLAAGACGGGASPQIPGTSEQPLILHAKVQAAITTATRDFILDAIDRAEEAGAEVLIIELDTPGGLLEATREIVARMLDSEVPVVVFVSPPGSRAGSAGVFITMAAHVAAMAPTTNIGAAHPVSLFGGDLEGDMADKLENDTAAWSKAIAQTRGRNVGWAERAVRDSESLPAEDALAQDVVDLIAEDLPHLIAELDGWRTELNGQERVLVTANARVERLEMSGRQEVVNFLANPNLLYILLLLGLLLLFIEYKNPGLIVPGVVGALLLILVLGVQVLPLNWVGVILILGAAALFVAEIYVTSFGLLSVGGLTCLILGSYLLFDVEGSNLRVDPRMIWGLGISFAALLLAIGYLLVRAKRQGATTGVEGMRGETAEVYKRITMFEPGQIRFRGAFWKATADEVLEPGTKVVVLEVKATRVKVQRQEPQGSHNVVTSPSSSVKE